jgi:FkbM family methyltransferase
MIDIKWNTRHGLAYLRHLSNGVELFYRIKTKKLPLPPFRFRNGIVWHHGPYDDPVLLFEEFYVDKWMPSLTDAPHGSVIIDIGANIGAATLLWASQSPYSVIHAFEPNPQAFATLEKNIIASNFIERISTHQTAINSCQGEIDLWVDVPTVLSTAYGNDPGLNGRKIKVPAITLDDAVRDIKGDIWLLKIDTEGAEGDILSGTNLSTLRRFQRIVLEWHDNIVPGVSDLCRKILDEAGFRFSSERVHPWNEGIFYCERK